MTRGINNKITHLHRAEVKPEVAGQSSAGRDVRALQSSLCSSLQSLKEYVVAEAHNSPVKDTFVSEDILPEAQESPSKGTHVSEDILAEGSVAFEALSMAESVDVLANDPVVVSSNSEWDCEERPMTFVSLSSKKK